MFLYNIFKKYFAWFVSLGPYSWPFLIRQTAAINQADTLQN